MATSTLGTFRANLATNITAQLVTDATTGVTVKNFPPGDQATSTDLVFIAGITTGQTRLVMGGPRAETMTAEIVVWVQQAGAGDTLAAAVEDRAVLIAASIEQTLRDDSTVGASVFDGQYAGADAEPGVTPEGRYTTLTVTVTAESHI